MEGGIRPLLETPAGPAGCVLRSWIASQPCDPDADESELWQVAPRLHGHDGHALLRRAAGIPTRMCPSCPERGAPKRKACRALPRKERTGQEPCYDGALIELERNLL